MSTWPPGGQTGKAIPEDFHAFNFDSSVSVPGRLCLAWIGIGLRALKCHAECSEAECARVVKSDQKISRVLKITHTISVQERQRVPKRAIECCVMFRSAQELPISKGQYVNVNVNFLALLLLEEMTFVRNIITAITFNFSLEDVETIFRCFYFNFFL